MDWRCAWCGKPHEERDPPCDSCGYNSFVAADDDRERTVDTGPEIVWACPNCGREHVRNTPPCARCGNPTLEKRRRQYEDLERDLDVPSWVDVAKPYAPIVVVLVAVVGLFATGVVPLSVLPGIGGDDVPGEGSEANGIDLEATALEVHDRLEEARRSGGTDAGGEVRAYDDELEALATAENHRRVSEEFGEDGGPPPDPDDFDLACGGTPSVASFSLASIDDYGDEGELAEAISRALLSSSFEDDVRSGYEAEGIDAHVGPDGSVFVLYAAC